MCVKIASSSSCEGRGGSEPPLSRVRGWPQTRHRGWKMDAAQQVIDSCQARRAQIAKAKNFIFIFIFTSIKAVRKAQTRYQFTLHQGTTVDTKLWTGIGAQLASADERVCWTQLVSLYCTYGRCPVSSSMALVMESLLISWCTG